MAKKQNMNQPTTIIPDIASNYKRPRMFFLLLTGALTA